MIDKHTGIKCVFYLALSHWLTVTNTLYNIVCLSLSYEITNDRQTHCGIKCACLLSTILLADSDKHTLNHNLLAIETALNNT
jgi:hypothetical protein